MTADQGWTEEAVDAAGGLDLLLTDAALGITRRLRPDSSLLRLAAGLARRPGFVARQAAQLGSELGQIAAGRSAIAADPRDRRFSDPAWKDNPFLRRAVQAYVAAAKTAEDLVDGAELGWRDDTRLKFLLANLVAAAAPSNNPLISPVAWKAAIETGGENVSAACAPWPRTWPTRPGCRRWCPPMPTWWVRTWPSRRAAWCTPARCSS
jgi:polyhydroxyalkanoate synthase subunit PhaC